MSKTMRSLYYKNGTRTGNPERRITGTYGTSQ